MLEVVGREREIEEGKGRKSLAEGNSGEGKVAPWGRQALIVSPWA